CSARKTGKSSSRSCAPSCIGESDSMAPFASAFANRGLRRAFAWFYLGTLYFAIFMARPTSAQEHPAAETIITNANVWTVDRNHPRAEAVAILNQRIVAVGTSAEL